MFKMDKKGIVWNKLTRWLLLLVLLVLVLIIIMDQKERIFEILDNLKDILRFAG